MSFLHQPADVPEMMELYRLLDSVYGDLKWWPAKSRFEMMIGAILTQNTAWSNVVRAIDGFGDRLTPEFIVVSELESIAEIIRPAGYFNVKARRLKALAEWYIRYGCNDRQIDAIPTARLREELLAINGVGRETADSILVYAYHRTSFVVDAYTRRLLGRIGFVLPTDYDEIRELIESQIPLDIALYNQFHALIVEQCKRHCTKQPICIACPLCSICKNQSET